MAVFAATLAWSLHDSGLGGSPVAYRVAGPIIMLVMIGLADAGACPLVPQAHGSVLAALIMATVVVGDLSTTGDGPLASSTVAASNSTTPRRKESCNE